jgi:hypothetical protein
MTDGSGRGGDQRFKEGSTGGGDVPRNHEEATPGPRPTLTIVRTTRRRSPGGSAVSRETSQPRGGRDPGGPHRGPVTFRDEKPMRGASGDRGAAARGNTLEGEKPRRATHRAPVQSTGARAADSRGEKNPVREDALRGRLWELVAPHRFGGAASAGSTARVTRLRPRHEGGCLVHLERLRPSRMNRRDSRAGSAPAAAGVRPPMPAGSWHASASHGSGGEGSEDRLRLGPRLRASRFGALARR